MKITHVRSAAVEIVKIIITKSTLHYHYFICAHFVLIHLVSKQGFFLLQIHLLIIELGYFFRVIFPPWFDQNKCLHIFPKKHRNSKKRSTSDCAWAKSSPWYRRCFIKRRYQFGMQNVIRGREQNESSHIVKFQCCQLVFKKLKIFQENLVAKLFKYCKTLITSFKYLSRYELRSQKYLVYKCIVELATLYGNQQEMRSNDGHYGLIIKGGWMFFAWPPFWMCEERFMSTTKPPRNHTGRNGIYVFRNCFLYSMKSWCK